MHSTTITGVWCFAINVFTDQNLYRISVKLLSFDFLVVVWCGLLSIRHALTYGICYHNVDFRWTKKTCRLWHHHSLCDNATINCTLYKIYSIRPHGNRKMQVTKITIASLNLRTIEGSANSRAIGHSESITSSNTDRFSKCFSQWDSAVNL